MKNSPDNVSPKTSQPAVKEGVAKPAASRRPSAAFMKPMTPSPALAAVIGSSPQPRTEITRLLWAYIKQNELQDPQNRRLIRADEKLKPMFGGQPSVNMFELTKLVNQNLSEPPPALSAPA